MVDIVKKLLNIGIIHNDIHPGNFLIDEHINIKIIDFELITLI